MIPTETTFRFSAKHATKLIAVIIIAWVLVSCSSSTKTSSSSSGRYSISQDGPPSEYLDVSQIPDAVPKPTKRSKSGNPKSYVVFGKRYYVMDSSKGYKARGIASWYGKKFQGHRTSSGEPYDMHGMTAAHKTLPLPTYVRVTNLKNGRQVVVKVNDRGPFHEGRIIDLSHTAAIKLGVKGTGTGLVEVEAIDPSQSLPAPQASTTATTVPLLPTPAKPIGLYLQLGAFISVQNAMRLKNKVNAALNARNETTLASVSNIEKNGQQYYRVRLGPLSDTDHADTLMQTLTENGFVRHSIVVE
ncbi:septal ring lytic transglycosylase RlpA family protein [sulfur-oxidizing endosymbiont of Gigantopelta aegis]|uniref:septal ring lytic transglycosylase RlpA family protein n=1 Tax=sulfur-oxidizing endosymbiont of Gigantopelta aegis TaxID=2794934 RepID=UPI0018DD81F8|nr:septal ring lytic transglycosylase RlpA family protein [sulfur-oxidizing endosymbiont of Gigantopelta aegis]